MQWESWQAFFAMGGYGGYVWGSFAVTAIIMIGELVLVRRRHRAARTVIDRARRKACSP